MTCLSETPRADRLVHGRAPFVELRRGDPASERFAADPYETPDSTPIGPTRLKRDGMNERNNDLNWQTLMRLADRLDPSYRQ